MAKINPTQHPKDIFLPLAARTAKRTTAFLPSNLPHFAPNDSVSIKGSVQSWITNGDITVGSPATLHLFSADLTLAALRTHTMGANTFIFDYTAGAVTFSSTAGAPDLNISATANPVSFTLGSLVTTYTPGTTSTLMQTQIADTGFNIDHRGTTAFLITSPNAPLSLSGTNQLNVITAALAAATNGDVLTLVDKTTGESEWTSLAAVVADTNFAIADLTADANRIHDWATFDYTHNNSDFSIRDSNVRNTFRVLTTGGYIVCSTASLTLGLPLATGGAQMAFQSSQDVTLNNADFLSLNATSGNTTELRLIEDAGINYIGVKAPASIAANVIWTLPAADGTAGQVLSTDGAGILSWESGDVSLSDGVTTVVNNSIVFVDGNGIDHIVSAPANVTTHFTLNSLPLAGEAIDNALDFLTFYNVSTGATEKITTANFISGLGISAGDGIYTASGTVPTAVVATLTDTINFGSGMFGIGPVVPTASVFQVSDTVNENSVILGRFSELSESGRIDLGLNSGSGYIGVHDTNGVLGVQLSANNDSYFVNQVGIGTTTPLWQLQVTRNNTDVDPQIMVTQAGTGDAVLGFIRDAEAWAIGIDRTNSDSFNIANTSGLGGNTWVSILPTTGYTGLGTLTPTVPLEVYRSNTAVTPIVLVNQFGTGDAALSWSIVGKSYTAGIDNTTDDFVISGGADLATKAALKISTTDDSLTVFRGFSHEESIARPGKIISTLVGTQNDFGPTSIEDSYYVHITSGSALTITGIDASGFVDGSEIAFIIDTAQTVTFEDEGTSGTSAAANRIKAPGVVDIVPSQNDVVTFVYDATTNSRWFCKSIS